MAAAATSTDGNDNEDAKDTTATEADDNEGAKAGREHLEAAPAEATEADKSNDSAVEVKKAETADAKEENSSSSTASSSSCSAAMAAADLSHEDEEMAKNNGSVQTEESILDEDEDDKENGDDEDDVADGKPDDLEALKSSMDNDAWLRYMDETDPTHRLRSLCKRGDLDALTAFLKSDESRGVDVDAQCKEGWTCLHEIITHECQFTDVARALVRLGGASVNTQDANGDSPLHSALLYHNADNIRLLLEAGADQTLLNAAGRMPVHVADDAESLGLLLDFGLGAASNFRDLEGNTPLHYAVCRPKEKDTRGMSSSKDRDRVALLLRHSADVNLKNGNGCTPLHLASDSDIAQLLLDAGADPNAPDSLGANTPLHAATKGRHKDIVRSMLRRGGDASLANAAGKTPLNLAKDREMRNILLGKDVTSVASASCMSSSSASSSSSAASKKKSATNAAYLSKLASVVAPECTSPSILKKRRRVSGSEDDVEGGGEGPDAKRRHEEPTVATGPRLRFSEVNDYSGVEVVEEERRVKVTPIYSEPDFSSDDDEEEDEDGEDEEGGAEGQ